MSTLPDIHGINGTFFARAAGLTAAAPGAGANYVSFRWTIPSLICLILGIRIRILVTVASTAGVPEFNGFVARNFTASDTGGTAIVIGTPSTKVLQNLSSSAVGDFRFGAGAQLTAGTRTLDGVPFIGVDAPIAIGSSDSNIWPPNQAYPLPLATNEGLVFQNKTTLTACVYHYAVEIQWIELASY